jgi:hypothetical protein
VTWQESWSESFEQEYVKKAKLLLIAMILAPFHCLANVVEASTCDKGRRKIKKKQAM